MEDKARPTKKQRELLNFVDNFISGHGYGPSYREIKSGLGYNSVATVALHIDNLTLKGYLKKGDKRARSLEVVDSSSQSFHNDQTPASAEKWLVKTIDKQFKSVEKSKKPTRAQVDNLYVLTGALKVLGLTDPATAFIARLGEIKKQSRF